VSKKLEFKLMTDSKPVFEFGKNWASFSELLNPERVDQAQDSLKNLLGTADLRGKTFLDIGCGSGLFSIAAVRMGATVLGIDLDPISIETSQQNAQNWLKDPSKVSFQAASVLDSAQLDKLDYFDIVYSWGVLHHTGNMKQALKNAAKRVKPGGSFIISIYNRHFTSPIWALIKKTYNGLPDFGQRALIWLFTPVIFFAKWIVTRKNLLEMHGRGMDFMHNVIDWLGGYPYEYASVSEIQTILESLGGNTVRVIPTQVPTGCNEFVCQMEG